MHFNIDDREEAIEFVKFIRKNRICGYVGNRCDCKYGIEPESSNKFGGEKTGCPELYQLISILEHIPKGAWLLALKSIDLEKQKHKYQIEIKCWEAIQEIKRCTN